MMILSDFPNAFPCSFSVPSQGPRDFSIFNVTSTNFTVCWRSIHRDFTHGIMRKFKLVISETLNDDTHGIYQIIYVPISTAGKYIKLNPPTGNSSVANSSLGTSHSKTDEYGWLFHYCHSFSDLRHFTRYHLTVAGCTTPGCGPVSESFTRTAEEGMHYL